MRPPRLDLLLAAGCVAFAVAEVLLNAEISPRSVALPCELVLAVAPALRTVRPILGTAVAASAAAAESIGGVPLQQPFLPLLVFLLLAYTLVSYVPPRRALVGTAVLLVGMVVQTVAGGKGPSNFLFGLVFFGIAWFLGWTVRRRTHEAVTAELAVALTASQAEQALAEERARLARELHDVIAHSVSAMVVQAGAAERVLAQAPDRALASVQAIGEIGRDALVELGRLLGVLREFGEEVGLEPQPGLGDLALLLDRSRALGVDVDLDVVGTPVPLPAGVELTVYRIVQESLTNVRKHAAGAVSAVCLTFRAGEVVIEVTNPMPDCPDGAVVVPGAGHGLLGMRERVAVYGGTLESGAVPGGGFAVTARIPTALVR